MESKRWLRSARPPLRAAWRRNGAIDPDAALSAADRRCDHRKAPLGHPHQWCAVAALLPGRAVSEQFFEVDLAALLDLPGRNDGLFALTEAERRHWLKVFALVFRREAFLPGAADARTFHQRAIAEGRFYEERVAASLSDLVFGQVFPELARAVAAAEPDAPLPEVREAALLLLYRLLFILYAEDRDLLPVRDRRYDDYALRDRVRGDVGRRKDQGDTFAETLATLLVGN